MAILCSKLEDKWLSCGDMITPNIYIKHHCLMYRISDGICSCLYISQAFLFFKWEYYFWIVCQDTFCIVVFKTLEITYLRTLIKSRREGLFIIICSTFIGQKPRVSILEQRDSFFNPKNLWNQIRDVVSWFCCFWHLLVIYQYLQDT